MTRAGETIETQDPHLEESLPRGLVLFPPGTSTSRKRQVMFFMVLYGLCGMAILWPIYPLFAAIEPLVFSLPLSLIWVIAALLGVFFALAWLYLGERVDSLEQDSLEQDLQKTEHPG